MISSVVHLLIQWVCHTEGLINSAV